MADLPSDSTSPSDDPASVTTKDELFGAVQVLLGSRSSSAAIAHRTGLGKSTIYAFRAGRGLSLASFEKIVTTYDPERRDQWRTAWARVTRPVRVEAVTTEPLTAGPPKAEAPAGSRTGPPAGSSVPADLTSAATWEAVLPALCLVAAIMLIIVIAVIWRPHLAG